MSNSRNVDESHLLDLLQTVLHAQLLLQRALGIVIQHFQGDARLHRTDIRGDSMFYNTVDLGSNDLAITTISDSVTDHRSTDAEVPNVTVHGDIRHPDREARDKVTDNL
jgi:hypothetical protein